MSDVGPTRRRMVIAGVVAMAIGLAVWWLAGAVRSKRAGEARTTSPSGEHGAAPRPLWHPAPERGDDDRDADPAGTIRLEGQVIDEQQQPVGAAIVAISTKPPRTVVTEADGSFAFDGLLARTYRLAAFKEGARANGRSVRVREDTEPVILHMHAGITVVVTALDGDGDVPIAGATVTTGGLLEQEVVTGADGRATLVGLDAWFNRVEIAADGFAPRSENIELPDDPGGRYERTVRLARGAPVSGSVLTPDGRGQAGAWVSAQPAADRGGLARAQADDDGRWTIPAVSEGDWIFSTPGLEYAPAQTEAIHLDGKTPRDGVELRLVAGGRIAGVVVDASGAPVPNAMIVFGTSLLSSDESADADGRFELRGLPRGSYSIAAREGDRASPAMTVDARTTDVAGVRLVVVEATISGTVIDASGEPVAEARVDARADGLIGLDGAIEASTDSYGRWTIGPLSAPSYRLRASWPDAPRARRGAADSTITVKPGDRDIRIVLPPAGTIRGTVVRGGAPVTRYGIVVGERHLLPLQPAKVVARADGRFERTGLAPGRYAVAIVGDDFGLTTIEDLEVAAGEVKDLGTVVVDEGRTVQGRVVDATGSPVAGAAVVCASFLRYRDGGLQIEEEPLRRARMNQRTATSGDDGGFTLRGLSATAFGGRPLHCAADKPSVGRSREVEVSPGETALTLTLETTGAIAVDIAGLDGDEWVSVDALPVEGRGAGADAFGAGRSFRLDGLVPGQYQVYASVVAAGMRTTPSVTVEVKSAGTVTATLTFPSGGVTLVIDGACQVAMLMPPGDDLTGPGQPLAGAQCEKDGTTEIADVAPGDYRLCASEDCIPITVTASPARQTVRLR